VSDLNSWVHCTPNTWATSTVEYPVHQTGVVWPQQLSTLYTKHVWYVFAQNTSVHIVNLCIQQLSIMARDHPSLVGCLLNNVPSLIGCLLNNVPSLVGCLPNNVPVLLPMSVLHGYECFAWLSATVSLHIIKVGQNHTYTVCIPFVHEQVGYLSIQQLSLLRSLVCGRLLAQCCYSLSNLKSRVHCTESVSLHNKIFAYTCTMARITHL